MTLCDRVPAETSRQARIPTLKTERLVLRAPRREDAADIVRLINDRRIAENTARIPHPYRLADAKDWIGGANTSADEEQYVITLDRKSVG